MSGEPGLSPSSAASELAPFCAHLASKRLGFLRRPARDESEVLDASQACWCRRTMLALGPDGAIVDPRDCRAGRGCYEPVL